VPSQEERCIGGRKIFFLLFFMSYFFIQKNIFKIKFILVNFFVIMGENMQQKNIFPWHNDTFFNVSKSEWIRLFPVLLVKLFLQVSLIAGTTTLIAIFIGHFSIDTLSVLFMAQSLCVIFGALIASRFLRKFSPGKLIIFGSFLSAISIIVSPLFLEFRIGFYALTFFGIFIALSQVSIWLSLYIENLFSPLEAERILPIIESSEPIGGIFSGLMIIAFVEEISAPKILFIVGGLLAIIPPLLMISLQKLESIPVLKMRREQRLKRRMKQNMFSNTISFFRNNYFISGLFLIIFLLFFIIPLLEFQYSHAVYEHVLHSNESGHSMSQTDALTHNFGEIQIIIFAILFFIQIIFSSKILQFLGVMRTFAVGPMLSFFAFAGMFFHFGFLSSVIAKGTFEISSGIGKNAFFSIFYSFREKLRDEAKEVLEGIAKPLGLFFGTLGMLFVQVTFAPESLPTVISVILCISTSLAFFLILKLQKQYTLVSKNKLDVREDLPGKMNAIEILSQQGHKGAIDYLIQALQRPNEIPEVKIKILKVIGLLRDISAIPTILKCFSDPNKKVRLAAVEALGKYHNLGKQFFSQAFSAYSVRFALRELFLRSDSSEIKIAAIKVFANLRDSEIIPFLIRLLKSKDSEVRAEVILVCGMFHDPGTISHIEPFLKDPDSCVRSATIIALWQFEYMREHLEEKIANMLNSPKESEILSGIHVIGEIKLLEKKEHLFQYINHKSHYVCQHAAIALAKMNEKDVKQHLIHFLFHEKKHVGLKTKRMLTRVDKNVQSSLKIQSMHEVSERVETIMKRSNTSILENFKTEDLLELFHLFHLIDAEKEVWKIRMILEERGEYLPNMGV
jgi:HEAT repeat protein/MFS family permease